jgi:hypothetical protein
MFDFLAVAGNCLSYINLLLFEFPHVVEQITSNLYADQRKEVATAKDYLFESNK